MTDLLALAAECEKAEGPDRELDGKIAAALGLPHGPWEEVHLEARSVSSGPEQARSYSGSIDAALTLVPERQGFTLSHDGPASVSAMVTPIPYRASYTWTRAATPALALCAAALRARAAGHGEG